MTWAELRPAFAKRRYPCAERASAHGLIARNNQEATSDWRAGSELEKDDFVKNKDNQNQTIEVENNNIDYQYVCNTSGIQADGLIRDGLERAILQLTEFSDLPANASKIEIKNAIREHQTDLKKAKEQLLFTLRTVEWKVL
ncbi:hypothetical protein [Bariatricus sp. HCP28S3_C2]